jgi:hypothetical protein
MSKISPGWDWHLTLEECVCRNLHTDVSHITLSGS